MKLITHMLFLATWSQLAICQQVSEQDYEITARVTHEDGSAIEGANINTLLLKVKEKDPILLTDYVRTPNAQTDSTGMADLKFKSMPTPDGKVSIFKNGYYSYSHPSASWQPVGKYGSGSWKADVKAVLKPIKKPIPMLVRRSIKLRTPDFGGTYGFDVEIGDALPPFGKGRVADFVLKLEGTRIAASEPKHEVVDLRMEVACPNKDDGMAEFIVEDTREFSTGSRLPSNHEAPEDGYVNKIERIYVTDSDGGLATSIKTRAEDERKCYYFRVRTTRDANGKIVTAHYGKMYGPLEIRPAMRRWGHDVSKGQGGFFISYLYFNPTPNDRNVEFDPKRNLIPDGNVDIP